MLRFDFFSVVFWPLLIMVSQCTGMESSQEATQIVEMRKIGAVHQLHDCSPSSPLFHPNPPGGSSSSPGSVSVDLSSELHGTLSNEQDSHELRITIDNQGRNDDFETSSKSTSNLMIPVLSSKSNEGNPTGESDALQNSQPDCCSICLSEWNELQTEQPSAEHSCQKNGFQEMMEKDRVCLRCQEEAEHLGNQKETLPCQHTFHQKCIQGWLNSHHTCPICRKDLTPENPDPTITPITEDDTCATRAVATFSAIFIITSLCYFIKYTLF
ncbi:hypothetical protein PGT21_028926 [Puccinia graminis f. sp. tritici]|uniref:RING-type domain-containing protein n=1 Tax=Puccinia graminis f. sp. tritici TaxID=56615 RepID=A0A5B0M7D8_PUCGR|nr:hypothetical protein PGT21_028926 [Puccinia graminis f. sp. tritici]KAA1135259.1 hypothetical protein PGTUg99_023014 [Puccinia graminis f. sp. tritici]